MSKTAARIRDRWTNAGHSPVTSSRSISAARMGPLTHSFSGEWRTPDAAMRFDLPTVRSRSREMAINSPVVKSFIEVLLNNVLGPTGMHFQMKVKTSKLFGDSTTGQPDTQANDIIETAYKLATNRENYLVSADMTKRLADELKLRTIAVDGEIFIRSWKPFENEVGMSRQLIDADLCDIDYNESELASGGQIRMGIEFDKWGARVAYHFLKQHPQDYQYRNRAAQPIRERVDAKEIRHLFVPMRPGQSRGLPLTAPALLSVRQIEAFVDAAVVNARIGANRNIYYTKQFPTGWTMADGPLDDKGAILDDLHEGESLETPYGVEPKILDTRFPDAAIETFTRVAMRMNSMGLGVAYSSLTGDLSQANFSSLRAGLNEERSGFARWQQMWKEMDCHPDFKEFLQWGLATQFIKLPAGKFRKFDAANFTGRAWSSVNPLQDSAADVMDMNNLVVSPQDVIRSRGGDPEDVLREIEEWKNSLDAKGLITADAQQIEVAKLILDAGKDEPSSASSRE